MRKKDKGFGGAGVGRLREGVRNPCSRYGKKESEHYEKCHKCSLAREGWRREGKTRSDAKEISTSGRESIRV